MYVAAFTQMGAGLRRPGVNYIYPLGCRPESQCVTEIDIVNVL